MLECHLISQTCVQYVHKHTQASLTCASVSHPITLRGFRGQLLEGMRREKGLVFPQKKKNVMSKDLHLLEISETRAREKKEERKMEKREG